jgi:hypothetical protein
MTALLCFVRLVIHVCAQTVTTDFGTYAISASKVESIDELPHWLQGSL